MYENSRGASIWSLVGLVACGILAASLVLGGLGALKESQARDGWRRSFGTDEQIRRQLNVEGPNRAALDVEYLAADLGVFLVPRHVAVDGSRPAPERDAQRAFNGIKPALQTFVYSQLARAEDGVEPPPDAVASWLASNSTGLVAVRERLRRDVPHWGVELAADPFDTPIPNLLGHIDLQKVLMAEALAALSSGDRRRALASLEAAWSLTGSLRDDPLLIGVLIAISETRMQTGLLRRIESPPAVWSARLRDLRLRDTMVQALHFDGWAWSKGDGAEVLDRTKPVSSFFLKFFPGYARYCVADLSDDYRRKLQSIDFEGPLCDAGLEGAGIDLTFPIPEWNLLAENLVPHLNGAIGRLARLELDVELTLRILGASAADEPSTTCPQDTWRVTRQDDGSEEIALDRVRSWPGQHGLILPTRYVRR